MAPAMAALIAAMLLVVVLYYCWPPWTALLSRYAKWQHSLGVVGAAIAAGLAGGVLSEFSIVYFQNGGRWTLASMENMAFKFVFFFIGGGMVYEFYQLQAWWWGDNVSWRVVAAKVACDQIGYSFVWATPYNALATRWQVNRYSFARLRLEFDGTFVMSRMLPALVASWMFWIPAVSIVYSVPLILQTPMFLFGTAIWGLLLPAVMRQGHTEEIEQAAVVAGLPDAE